MRQLMRRALKGVSDDLSAALDGSGVHPARKRLKLGRSLLRMMGPALGEELFRREDACLRGASHALADLRRTEAMVEAVVVRVLAIKYGGVAVIAVIIPA